MAFNVIQEVNTVDTISNQKAQSNYVVGLCILAVLYFLIGFVTVLNDTLVPFFKQGFSLSYAESSLVQFYFFLTYGLISIPAGRIVEKLSYKTSMVLGFAIAGVGALLFFPASRFHEYALFLLALFIVAIGIVLLQVAANPYITVMGKPETAASRLTLIQGVGSIGTTLAPIFGAHFVLSKMDNSIQSSEILVKPYVLLGIVLFFISLIVFFLKMPKIETPKKVGEVNSEKKDKALSFTLFKHRNLKFGVIALFLYVGAEVSIGTFLTNYIADRLSISDHNANFYLSLYWGGMLVGRFVGAYFLKYFASNRILTVISIVAMFLIIMSLSTGGYISVWMMVCVGLCNSIMFATIFSLAVNGLGSMTTRASGLLSTAIVGGAFIPYLQGLVLDRFTWEIAFIIPVFCFAFIAYYGWNGYRESC
ncbi:sugar MFS transporter [Sphingobacterium faecale]|uniref:Sugar MFS transporter n=1 Tax=Sphingobacterium faecale TaxID=2803775 RepID=A0ABS1R7Y2_9SPHI|nr:sugar MFS transporter [Sphingobacterium faecale]MBL1410669.1 sugar MFS transporter [Sphingobacterium faecale]